MNTKLIIADITKSNDGATRILKLQHDEMLFNQPGLKVVTYAIGGCSPDVDKALKIGSEIELDLNNYVMQQTEYALLLDAEGKPSGSKSIEEAKAAGLTYKVARTKWLHARTGLERMA